MPRIVRRSRSHSIENGYITDGHEFYILAVFGNSAPWGQGLRNEHKSATLVANTLATTFPGIQPLVRAHSGAVIGRSAHCIESKFPGEMPESCPSILQQVAADPGDPAAVPAVILDGRHK